MGEAKYMVGWPAGRPGFPAARRAGWMNPARPFFLKNLPGRLASQPCYYWYWYIIGCIFPIIDCILPIMGGIFTIMGGIFPIMVLRPPECTLFAHNEEPTREQIRGLLFTKSLSASGGQRWITIFITKKSNLRKSVHIPYTSCT